MSAYNSRGFSLFSLFSSVRYKAAYEGEGRTTVRVINQEQDLGLIINSYGTVRYILIAAHDLGFRDLHYKN